MLTQNKILKFRLTNQEFGDGIHLSLTGAQGYSIALGKFEDYRLLRNCWAITMWVDNLKSGEECTLDFGMTIKSTFKQVFSFISPILADYLKNCHAELDSNDLSEKEWKASVSIRRMTAAELQYLTDQGGEIWLEPQRDDEFSIRYDGELLPYEECEFDYPLFNQKPNVDKLIRNRARKK